MPIPPIIIAIMGGLAFWGLIGLWQRWLANRIMSRVVEQVLNEPKQIQSKPRSSLDPESKFVLRLTDAGVICERPDGKVERVTWNELQKVEVLTTSDGPFAPDVFWVLHGIKDGCVIPQGATGDSELLNRLQTLPGFDNQRFIEAMACTSEGTFLCWQSPTELNS